MARDVESFGGGGQATTPLRAVGASSVVAMVLAFANAFCGTSASNGTDASAAPLDATTGVDAAPDAARDAPASSADGAASDASDAGTRRGVSGWVYSNSDALAGELVAYDTAVQSGAGGEDRRVRYLFPYGGSVSITGTTLSSASVSYDATASAFYASRLPYASMLPIVDSGDGANLTMWSTADQEALAAEIARPILADPNALGVHVDVEPFNAAQLPFYTKLQALLHAGAKTLAVFTGSTTGSIYGVADVVVLSGYDLGISPVTTANYTQTLDRMVGNALASAADAGSLLLVGIPASASFEEYSTLSGTCDGGTGYTQQQWLAAAWQAVCPHYADSHYLGLSLWQVASGPLAVPRSSTCLRNPGDIEDASWGMLEIFDPTSCP